MLALDLEQRPHVRDPASGLHIVGHDDGEATPVGPEADQRQS